MKAALKRANISSGLADSLLRLGLLLAIVMLSTAPKTWSLSSPCDHAPKLILMAKRDGHCLKLPICRILIYSYILSSFTLPLVFLLQPAHVYSSEKVLHSVYNVC